MKLQTRLTCALAFVCAVSSAAVCTNPVCPVTGSFVTDPSGSALASGTIVFVPNMPFRIPTKGQAVPTIVSATITNGAFTTNLADTTQTIPANISYRAYIMDASGKIISGANYYAPGLPYQSIQMTGSWCTTSGCTFDTYDPSIAALPITASGVSSLTVNGGSAQSGPVSLTIPAALALKVNGTNNGSQAILNLKAGTNTTLADDGSGGVTITSGAGSGSGGVQNAVQVNNGAGGFSGVFNGTATKLFLCQTSGGAPAFCSILAADVPTLNQNTSGNAATATAATNLASGAVGAIPYQSGSNTTAFLSGNTGGTDQVLVSHGTGSAAQAPTLTNAPTLSAANMSGLPAANISGILGVSSGGTGTATPGLVAGSNVTISGTWPNQTVASSGAGGGALPSAGQAGQAPVSSGAGTTYVATTLAASATTDTTNTTNVNYTAPSGTVRTQAAKNQDIVSVKDYGATGNGSTDDTTAINTTFTYATANNKVVVFPAGTYIVTAAIEVTASVRGDRNVTIKASGITGAGSSVLKAGSTTPVSNLYIEGITVDANGTADNAIFLRQYKHIMLDHVNVLNFQVNGLHAGDTSISTPSFYEMLVHDFRAERTTGTIPVGSSGIFIDGGTDSSISQAILMDADIGLQSNTGGNFFTDVHAWSHPSKGNMTIGVQINSGANGNFFKSVEADTVSVAGFKDAAFNSQYVACRVYNGTAYSLDNVAYAWWFTQASPGAYISNALVLGSDSSHRILNDVFPTGISALSYENNAVTNVTNHVIDSVRYNSGAQFVGNLTVGSANQLFWGPKTQLSGAANAGSATDGGTLLVRNNAASGYGAVALGSTTSSNIKLLSNNSTTLDIKLGDESAYANANLLGATVQGGNLLFATDGTGTIGAVSANRPANIYAQNTVRAAGGFVGALYPGSFSGSNIRSSTDGNVQITNNAGTGFTCLQFGTTSSTSPGWCVSGTVLKARLSDNSADTTISAGGVQWAVVNKSATYTAVATDYTIIGDATSAAFSINLEASPTIGQVHTFKKRDSSANAVTINGNGHNIDGATTFALSSQWKYVTVQYDTANTVWIIIANN